MQVKILVVGILGLSLGIITPVAIFRNIFMVIGIICIGIFMAMSRNAGGGDGSPPDGI